MRPSLVVTLIACLFVAAAVIAYKAVQVQMKPATTQQVPATNPSADIEKLLRDFLLGAGTNDAAVHDRFWADDLIYTGASGVKRTKAEIMKSVRESAAHPDPKEPETTYSAEDITIHEYGDFAVVNFRLVAQSESNGKPDVQQFRNTGTFRRVNGEWKVIGWQATKIQEPKN